MSRYENRIARLERAAAPRRKPVELAPEPKRAPASTGVHRAATLEMLRHQLLFGEPGATGPFPSRALPERAAELLRARALATPAFQQLEQRIASDAKAGAQIFGPDWPRVAFVFGVQVAPKRKRAPLEPTDLNAWRRARWAGFLASDEGRAAIESGRLHPAPERGEHAMQPAAPHNEGA